MRLHRLERTSETVTRYTSSWNIDYQDKDWYFSCKDCGWRTRDYQTGGWSSSQNNLAMAEVQHNLEVLAAAIPEPNMSLRQVRKGPWSLSTQRDVKHWLHNR